MKESLNRTNAAGQHGSIREYREILTNKRIFTFVPAWLAINAMIGAWLTLSLIILAYPTSTCRVALEKVTDNIKPAVQAFSQNYCAITHGEVNADARFPNQLLHGGFLPGEASNIVGLYGVVFILGMGIWTVFVPKMRRTSVMVLALGGLFVSCGALLLINGLGNNPLTITETARNEMWVLLPIVLISVVVMSGFTPAALTHMAAISETLPGKRGAVMGLYSVLLGLGQLVGVFVGGLFVDLQGFNGLMIYSLILGVISLGSVIYMRSHNHDIDDHLKPGQQIAH
jgi:MFS family permease